MSISLAQIERAACNLNRWVNRCSSSAIEDGVLVYRARYQERIVAVKNRRFGSDNATATQVLLFSFSVVSLFWTDCHLVHPPRGFYLVAPPTQPHSPAFWNFDD